MSTLVNCQNINGDNWARARLVNETATHVELCLNGRKHHAFLTKVSLTDYNVAKKAPKPRKSKLSTVHYSIAGVNLQISCSPLAIAKVSQTLVDVGAEIIKVDV